MNDDPFVISLMLIGLTLSLVLAIFVPVIGWMMIPSIIGCIFDIVGFKKGK